MHVPKLFHARNAELSNISYESVFEYLDGYRFTELDDR